MSARTRAHIKDNVVGYVALFFALTGGVAWATHPGGANTIDSADIINNEVRSADIRDANVATPEIRTSAVTTGKIGDGEVRSADVLDDDLTGADVNESALGQVPDAGLLDGLDSSRFPQRTDMNALNRGLHFGASHVRTFVVPGDRATLGGVELESVSAGVMRVCTNLAGLGLNERVPYAVYVGDGSGSANVTRTEGVLGPPPPAGERQCSPNFTLGVAADFQVMARDSIFFGWEPRSFNSNPRGETFAVIGFQAG
jgi:hypothetical protein